MYSMKSMDRFVTFTMQVQLMKKTNIILQLVLHILHGIQEADMI